MQFYTKREARCALHNSCLNDPLEDYMLIYDPYDEDGNYGNSKPYFVVKEEDYQVLECDGGPRFSGNHEILEIQLYDPCD